MNEQLKMKMIKCPDRADWAELCERPVMEETDIRLHVERILNEVKKDGDDSLLAYTSDLDGVDLEQIKIDLKEKEFSIDPELANAIALAKSNITNFHKEQAEKVKKIETMKGVTCWRKSVPIQKVGLYIPGGSAPLFSTLLMLVIPAQLAGCEEIVVCTPPKKNGEINEIVGWTAKLLGIESIYLVGGAQSIGAMAYGTQSIPRVNKIFGPGNQYVTAAKQLVQNDGIAIDMPAGPSEVLVIADKDSTPEFVAADLLSQAEHGPDSQVLLVSDSEDLIDKVDLALTNQLSQLPRSSVVEKSLSNSATILVKNLDEAIDFSNTYAPEHLILATENCDSLAEKVVNAGSVFLGKWSCESAGDYASGTNHTLPTNGFAKNYSGVSLDSFIRKITFQKIDKQGISSLGPSIEKMAEAEGLQGHKRAVSVRLNNLDCK